MPEMPEMPEKPEKPEKPEVNHNWPATGRPLILIPNNNYRERHNIKSSHLLFNYQFKPDNVSIPEIYIIYIICIINIINIINIVITHLRMWQ